MSAATSDQLRALLTPVVSAVGLDLDSVSITPAGRRRVVRVAVDKDGGVSLDDVAETSRRVSDALDSSDVMGEQAYVLEVGSPGVDRPLTEPKHWRRATGRLVAAELAGGDSLTGRVIAADADGVVLAVDGHDRLLSYSQVTRALVQVEFGRSDTNGSAEESAEESANSDRADRADRSDGSSDPRAKEG